MSLRDSAHDSFKRRQRPGFWSSTLVAIAICFALVAGLALIPRIAEDMQRDNQISASLMAR